MRTMSIPRLGVNIDHVATLRQARGGQEPDPVWAAAVAELGGADGITIHLREDRRHIQERDLRLLRQTVQVRLNLELAAEPAMVELALEVRPDQVTLVPERREELTTEGGLDVVGQTVPDRRGRESVPGRRNRGRPLPRSRARSDRGRSPPAPPRHRASHRTVRQQPLRARRDALSWPHFKNAAATIVDAGLELHAGHGLNYRNVQDIARLDRMAELNIGHSIICRSLFVGLERAVREMKNCMIQGSEPA